MPMDRLAAYVARYGMTTVWIEDFRTTAQIRPSFPAPAGLLRDTMLGFYRSHYQRFAREASRDG